ncbi:hypothetical protein O6H91_11G049800 [Diphasiastrum complanatum]|uniref:Uncharacterized protein n=1 Tax=Diphasiastrum complanatum TaxID=34168 RepID=A0ACC2C8V9_DIPCM|nr:hypothetical protein O6H91_11G049800 [Diphasiastrum complanatum]
MWTGWPLQKALEPFIEIHSWTSPCPTKLSAAAAGGGGGGAKREEELKLKRPGLYSNERASWICKTVETSQRMYLGNFSQTKEDKGSSSRNRGGDRSSVGRKNFNDLVLNNSNCRRGDAFENVISRNMFINDDTSFDLQRSYGRDARCFGSNVPTYKTHVETHEALGTGVSVNMRHEAYYEELKNWEGKVFEEKDKSSDGFEARRRERLNSLADGSFQGIEVNQPKQDYLTTEGGGCERSAGDGKREKWSSRARKQTIHSDSNYRDTRGNDASDNHRDIRSKEGKIECLSSARVEDKDGTENDNGFRDSQNVSRRRVKEPKIRTQVHLSSGMSKDPHIAILGGGMSGLMCAVTLEERGIRSTIFDTGKHGLGGRLATRHVAVPGGVPLVFDHAAQFFTVSDPQFRKFIDHWISEGVVKQWHGVIGTLRLGHFLKHPQGAKYIATNGMSSLADHIVSQGKLITVKRPCWISSMDARSGRWHLMENGQSQGYYDAVVIAHNGKCANRLLASSGIPLVAKQMKRLELSAVWALLAAFKKPLPLPKHMESTSHLDGAFVEGVDSLSWIANNTTKLSLPFEDNPHCWTFFSTAAYGQKNKVPQESIPNTRVRRVTKEMLHGVEVALGLAEGSLPSPLYSRVQLWGAALPKNTPNVPCIFDPYGRVGVCGDWLLGSSVEAAVLSGMALANHISEFWYTEEASLAEYGIGLDNNFTSIVGHDIGQFPGSLELCSSQVRVPLEV